MYGLFLRLFTSNPFTVPWIDAPALVTAAVLVCVVFSSVLVLRSIPRRPIGTLVGIERASVLLHAGLVYGFALAIGPLTQGDYLFYVIPGFAGLLQTATHRRSGGSIEQRPWDIAVVVWLLVFVQALLPWLWYWGMPDPEAWTAPVGGFRLLLTGRVGASLMLAGLSLWAVLYWEQRRGLTQKA